MLIVGAWAGTRTTMQGMLHDLEPLLVLSLNEDDWRASGSREKIESGLKSLSAHSHSIRGANHGDGAMDPSFALLAPDLGRQVNLALAAYRMGQFEFSRGTVRALTASCFACHSRMPGWNGNGPPDLPDRLKNLPILEQARLQATLRRVEPALALYRELLLRPDFQKDDPVRWNRALRESLTIRLRVKRDPGAARKELQELARSRDLPAYMKKEMRGWIEDLRLLMKPPSPKPQNEDMLMKTLRTSFREAKARRLYPMDHAGDVRFLDLTGLLFDFERRHPDSPALAEIEFMQGLAHETLDMPPYSNLHELFYESCIRRRPHSALAMQCYEHLERSVVSGFTGSSGTRVPMDAKNRLLELWALAVVPGKEVP